MVTVYRVTAIWSGFTGAPGYSRFSFNNLTDATSRQAAGNGVRQMFDDLKSLIPFGTQIQIQQGIEEYDMATGQLTGASSMTTTPTVVNSTASLASYAGGSGVCMTWRTSVIFNGRRVKGRTFFVPAVDVYQNDGTITNGLINTFQLAGNTLAGLAAAELCVWAKLMDPADPKHQIGGALAPVDSCTVRDTASQLRSRRV